MNQGSNVLDDVKNAVSDGKSKVGEAVGGIVDDATGKIVEAVNAIDEKTSFNKKVSKAFAIPFDKKGLKIIDKSFSCPVAGPLSVGAGVQINADLKGNLNANVGFMITGSIVPPNIGDIAFTGG